MGKLYRGAPYHGLDDLAQYLYMADTGLVATVTTINYKTYGIRSCTPQVTRTWPDFNHTAAIRVFPRTLVPGIARGDL